jgi:hypothetical protein
MLETARSTTEVSNAIEHFDPDAHDFRATPKDALCSGFRSDQTFNSHWPLFATRRQVPSKHLSET